MGRTGSSQGAPRKPSHRLISLPPPDITDFHLLLGYYGAEKRSHTLKTTQPLLSTPSMGGVSGPRSNRVLWCLLEQLTCSH